MKAPFTIGDRIIFRNAPQFGEMRVAAVRLYDNSHDEWEVIYEGDNRTSGCCPAWRVRALPADWEPPPLKPFGALPVDSSPDAWELKHATDEADPVYQEQLAAWSEAYALWLRKAEGWRT